MAFGRMKIPRNSWVRRWYRRLFVEDREWLVAFALNSATGDEYPPRDEWQSWPLVQHRNELAMVRDAAYEAVTPELETNVRKERWDAYVQASQAVQVVDAELQQARQIWWQQEVRRLDLEAGEQNRLRLQNQGALSLCVFFQSTLWGTVPYLGYSAYRGVSQWWGRQVQEHGGAIRTTGWSLAGLSTVLLVVGFFAVVGGAFGGWDKIVAEVAEVPAEYQAKQARSAEWRAQEAARQLASEQAWQAQLAEQAAQHEMWRLAYPEEAAAEDAAKAEALAKQAAYEAQVEAWDAEREARYWPELWQSCKDFVAASGGVVAFLLIAAVVVVAFLATIAGLIWLFAWLGEKTLDLFIWSLINFFFIQNDKQTERAYLAFMGWWSRWVSTPSSVVWSWVCRFAAGTWEFLRLMGSYAVAMYRGICPLLEFEQDPAEATSSDPQ